ncbi:hypothetical protein OEA41_008221 [Lepraria neglecta]|uniref:Uncharacterized protein n=1 Tax=Lepraria neglecta TaxID=209136 RepID=A0AAE0DQV8_9LECA|nr:hypothetical protein OEA41_008221 [Lepraria neglecta]
MALRIFIKFRTDQVPGPSAEKDLLVATAACLELLGRDFNFERDFIHAQGEVLQEKARCHVLIDCDYHDSRPDPKDAVLRFYHVVEDEATFALKETHVHRGLIDKVPWGRHSV